MTERRLFILLEGNDDERFFDRIIVPLIAHRYRSVKLIKYACLKSVRVCKFIRSIRRMGDELMVVADIDQAPDVWAKKQVIMGRFCVSNPGEIIVIIQEIESWYLAGLGPSDAGLLGVRPPHTTDHVTKEIFNQAIPLHYISRIAYMIEILSRFSIPTACRKNRSFHYFMNHYHLVPASPENRPERDPTVDTMNLSEGPDTGTREHATKDSSGPDQEPRSMRSA